MLEMLLEIDFNKIRKKPLINNLCAGVVFDKYGKPLKKILFIRNNNKGYNVFNNESYPIEEGEDYISEVVDLGETVYNFFHVNNLNFYQLIMVYKMFLNDKKFINKHLEYFGMKKVPVGYDEKSKIVESFPGYLKDKVNLYYGLLKIQNYKSLKKEREHDKHATK